VLVVVGIVIYYLSSDIIIVIIIIIMIPTIKQQLQPMSFDGEGTELPSLRLQSGNTYYDGQVIHTMMKKKLLMMVVMI